MVGKLVDLMVCYLVLKKVGRRDEYLGERVVDVMV